MASGRIQSRRASQDRLPNQLARCNVTAGTVYVLYL
jgi:hypothetical protein